MNCKNCGNTIGIHFCPNCGQRSSVGKIDFPYIVSNLSSNVFQIDKGFFFTIKELFMRPGHTIREYIHGKRKKHFGPFAYVLLLSTFYFFLTKFLGSVTVLGDFMIGFSNKGGITEDGGNPYKILDWFIENYAYTVLLLIPVYSLASYLAFRKSRYNYFEHVILNSYITGHQAIFYALGTLLCWIVNSEFPITIAYFTTVFYSFWVFWQFFHDRAKFRVILFSLLAYILSLVFIGICLLGFIGINEALL